MNRLQPLESLIEVCVSCGFVCLVPDRCVSHMVAWIAGCYSVGFYGYRRDHYTLQITDYGSRARFNDSVVVCHVLSSCGSNRAPNQLFPIEHTVLSIEYRAHCGGHAMVRWRGQRRRIAEYGTASSSSPPPPRNNSRDQPHETPAGRGWQQHMKGRRWDTGMKNRSPHTSTMDQRSTKLHEHAD